MERIQKLIDYLQGTCKGLYEACEFFGFDETDLTMEELEILDEHLFCCTCCGWWYEICEEGDSPDGDRYCTSCSEDEN